MIRNLFLAASACSEESEKLCQFVRKSLEHWTTTSWIELGLLGLFIVVFVWIIFTNKFGSRSVRKWIIRHLMLCALFVFIIGFCLYVIGFNWEGSECNSLALILRSVVASMEMFVSESELIEVAEAAKGNQWYMSIFAVVHFLAICVSAAFIIHIMGIRCKSYIYMKMPWKKKKDVYVFFDLSPESINLAKDIYKNKSKKDQSKDGNKRYQVIFVKTPLEGKHIDRLSFFHILSYADSHNETIEELLAIDAYLTYSRKSIVIGMDEKEWKDTVGLNALRNYLKRCSGNKYFFCMSSNEENNISTAVALSKRYSDPQKHYIYCRANQNNITDSLSRDNLFFINSANLSVLEFKKNIAYQPASFVKPDINKGVATKPFRSMIVGFGETGFEVFSFLYEFGALVGKDANENPFYCDIIDPKAKILENNLYLQCPTLDFLNTLDEDETKVKNTKIVFHEGTIENNRKTIELLINDLDYIVVCTNDEKENISIGITLLNLAYRYRQSSDKLGIFIGVKDNKEYQKAVEIAKYYNECGKREDNGSYRNIFIVPFGAYKQIFTYNNIVNDELLEKAKTFFYEYQKTSGLLDTSYKSERADNKDIEWHSRKKKKPTTKCENGLSNKNELMLKETQDKENVWHMHSKLYLVGACCYSFFKEESSRCQADERRETLYRCIQYIMQKLIESIEVARKNGKAHDDSYSFIQAQLKEYEKENNIPEGEYQTLFENLAKCEHLRWNATCRMMGYRPFLHAKGNEKNHLQKLHACLISYEDIKKDKTLCETIKYDYNTILVSFDNSIKF